MEDLSHAEIAARLRGAAFAAAFGRGDVRGWPLALLPDFAALLSKQSAAGLSPAERALLRPGVLADGVEAGKLARLHPEVGVAQYLQLQRALGEGEVLLQQRGGRKASVALLLPEGGAWWIWAYKQYGGEGRRLLRTIFQTTNENYLSRLRTGGFVLRRRGS